MAVSVKRRGKFRSLTAKGPKRTRSSFRTIAGRKVTEKDLPRLQTLQALPPLFKKARGRIKTAPAREALARKRTRAKIVKVKRKAQIPITRATGAAKRAGAKQSSNVWRLGYDPSTEIMIVDFNSGSRYKAEGVSQDRFDNLVNGRATCTTEGKNKWGKWWIGKGKSLGAAYWKYIRRANIKVTLLWDSGGARP